MSTTALGSVTPGARTRLAHYGPDVAAWLDTVPDLLQRAARRWRLTLGRYHDAGYASVIATATDQSERPLIVKLWFDPDRYRHETSAMRLWADALTATLIAVDDTDAVAVFSMVAGRPGGSQNRTCETPMVALAIQGLHMRGRAGSPPALPRLQDHVSDEILPRLERRLRLLRPSAVTRAVAAAIEAGACLSEDPDLATVLHGDLYRENVLFDAAGNPRLIDPLPMYGDAVFDWAFWTVYYDLGSHTIHRLNTAANMSGISAAVIAQWARLLAADGLLYYLEALDPRARRMRAVLALLGIHLRSNE
jgi:streptomycin 6-kinase